MDALPDHPWPRTDWFKGEKRATRHPPSAPLNGPTPLVPECHPAGGRGCRRPASTAPPGYGTAAAAGVPLAPDRAIRTGWLWQSAGHLAGSVSTGRSPWLNAQISGILFVMSLHSDRLLERIH
jgi:hypothetical protein